MSISDAEIKKLVEVGMRRFAKGPPKVPSLVQMRDCIERIIAPQSPEERYGASSALILSIRAPSDTLFLTSEALAKVSEDLIEASAHFMKEPTINRSMIKLRAAFNTVQAVYCAEVPEGLDLSVKSVQADADHGPSPS